MSALVGYRLVDGVATLTLDDGRVNALSPAMLAAVDAALDRAEAEAAVTVLRGRPGRWSGGFDLGVLLGGGAPAADMVVSGFRLLRRVLAFPTPTVVACTGHAVAMGAFLLLCADHRIGVTGDVRVVANEVALGMVMPRTPTEVMRHRLTPPAFQQAVVLAEPFDPESAVRAGFLDAVVAPSALDEAVRSAATRFAALDRTAHTASKLRARAGALEAVAEAIVLDDQELRARMFDAGR